MIHGVLEGRICQREKGKSRLNETGDAGVGRKGYSFKWGGHRGSLEKVPSEQNLRDDGLCRAAIRTFHAEEILRAKVLGKECT